MIHAAGLTKLYGGRRVVDDVSFACETGTITGLVGPNGAGKSTTLRMLCGLTRPDAGAATVDGVPFARLPAPAGTVGVLLDASAFHPGRTGRATLRRAAEMAGAPAARAAELLERVGLSSRDGGRRVGTYSLGMRQRLGLAVALVGEPRALILDEPANGLDPEGIAGMRVLLRDFAAGGGAVVLSSHLLGEVEATADRLVVIRAGRVVAGGPLAELLKGSGVHVRSPDAEGLERALRAAGLAVSGRRGDALTVDADAEAVARVALDARILVVELRPPDRPRLEELFFSLTEDGAA